VSWILPKLTKRVQILKPTQRPNEDGGFDLGFGQPLSGAFTTGEFDRLAPLLTVWMGMRPLGYSGGETKYIRGQQVNPRVTHEFIVYQMEVANLGKQFNLSFSGEFKFMADLAPLKADYFLFLQENSTAVKGRLFRVYDVMDIGEMKEYLAIAAEELEERGTGYPA